MSHAHTANEQRIAVLEAEVVTMRGALEAINLRTERIAPSQEVLDERHRMALLARDALSTSADYAGKVVVDREELELLNLFVQAARCHECLDYKVSSLIPDEQCSRCHHLARLDSLRKGGGK